MSLRSIRRAAMALLVAGAGYLAWAGHAGLPAAGGQFHPALYHLADGGLPTVPPPPS
jgi:hypothetical protein